ncbi:MAG: F0F1 ATP synthase subunit B [Rhizobiales bacterium]|nr:F0F1 ATP synthase subunit B [Hyphomicrobiales bacterium]
MANTTTTLAQVAQPAATQTEVGHEPADAKTFPPFDPSTFGSQLLWLAITFGLLYYAMSKVVLPRIGSILEMRSDRIEQDMAEAQRFREETDTAIAAYEQALADARSKAHGIAQTAANKAKAEFDEKMTKVEAGLSAKLADADKQIAGIRTSAMAEVNAIAAEATEAVVKALIGGKIAKTEIKNALESVGE